MDQVWAALGAAGLLPSPEVTPADFLRTPDADLLPWLVAMWASTTGEKGTVTGRGPRVLPRLQGWQSQGAQLTWGVPGCSGVQLEKWLGGRLFFWPRGVPCRRRVGVVSSRLGRDLDRHRTWFALLRAVCMRLDAHREVLLTAGATTPQRFVRRCGALFGVSTLQLDVGGREGSSLRRWARGALLKPTGAVDDSEEVPVSPALPSAAATGACQLADAPAPDRAVVALSDRLVVLQVRRGGHIERLLRARLADPTFPPASVYLALGPDLTPQDVADELLGQGAVGWCLLNRPGPGETSAPWRQVLPDDRLAAPVIDAGALDQDRYLTHCTRRRHGPWPDEPESQFLDDLILDRAGADHSAFAALWRIAQTQRLIATTDMVRGDVPVVSFTAVPARELGRLHAYRSHLSRWDFEPYGISIRREWLAARGTRPVTYGEESLWDQLPAGDQPFFQLRQSRSAGGTVWDWTVEREWRHVGDVRLDTIPADTACLFVPTAEEARQLAQISRWPVVVAPFVGQADRPRAEPISRLHKATGPAPAAGNGPEAG